MGDAPPVDLPAAHRHFAAACFNETWDLLDNPARGPADNRRMLATAWASLYHWLQRPDCSDEKRAIGFWQISRVHAVLNLGPEALRWAEVCAAYSTQLSPFLRGFALEAIARAARLTGQQERAELARRDAQALLAEIDNPADRQLLEKDLATV